MKLFPYVLLRLGTIPFKELEKLNFSIAFQKRLQELIQAKIALELTKNQLHQELNAFIQMLNAYQLKTYLKHLRSDIHNERTLKSVQKITSLLKSSGISQQNQAKLNHILSEIIFYQNQKKQHKHAFRQYEIAYQNAIQPIRGYLQQLAFHENLQKGLILSSRSLLGRLKRYQQTLPEQFRKKTFQTERSVWKYISRIGAKTSPYSTFTALGLGLLVEGAKQKGREAEENWEVESHIRLNNYLFRHFKTLLQLYTPFALELKVRLNPTLRIEDGQCLFLLNSHNVESFQRIELNGVLELLMELMKNKPLIMKELVAVLLTYIDATQAEVVAYLQQLIDYGWLEFDFGVSGLDANWDKALIEKLRPHRQIAWIDELIATLKAAHTNAMAYGKAEMRDRLTLLQTTFDSLLKVSRQLSAAIRVVHGSRMGTSKEGFSQHQLLDFHFEPEQIFYEDTTIDVQKAIDKHELQDLIQPLNALIAALNFTSKQEFLNMTYFFKTHYGENAKIGLFEFYEAYYKNFKKTLDTSKVAVDQATSPAINAQKEKLTAWTAALLQQVELNEIETNITLEAIQKTNELLKIESEPLQNVSLGCFLQTFKDKNQLNGVINAAFLGFGKMWGRFLPILSDRVYEEIVQWNQQLDGVWIEAMDASYFNANMHPPLLPYEIWMPQSNNQLPTDKQIPITALAVKMEADKLMLWHLPTEQRAYVLDLGFQTLAGRSPLYQLLSYFNPCPNLVLSRLEEAVYQAMDLENSSTGKGVTIYPRIVLEQRLILQRRTWKIPRDRLPFKQPSETNAAYFERVNRWRMDLGLPDAVFITLQPKTELKERPEHDHYKPQYIHFYNPIAIQFLSKNWKNVRKFVLIREKIPDYGKRKEQNNSDYIKEMVIQWYF